MATSYPELTKPSSEIQIGDDVYRKYIRKVASLCHGWRLESGGNWTLAPVSDALLMNVFCYPGVFQNGRLGSMLDTKPCATPEFGFRARVPLADGKFDRTEVDMRLGDLLVEAKLTETGFQSAGKEVVRAYRDFGELFEPDALPQTPNHYQSYQLIRNVLAAHASGCAFCLLTDARRPGLIEACYGVVKCVRWLDLRLRCRVLTWQELAHALPPGLRKFLGEKYGIE